MACRNSSVAARRMSAIEGDVAADELLAVQVEGAVDVERLGDRRHGVLLGLGLHRVVGVGGAHFARVLREAERRIGGAGDQRVERADEVEHRAVDHRPLRRIRG